MELARGADTLQALDCAKSGKLVSGEKVTEWRVY